MAVQPPIYSALHCEVDWVGVPLAGVPSQKPNTLSLLQDFSSSAPIGVPIMPAGRAAEEFVELSGLEPKISEPKSDVLPLHHNSV